MSLEAQMMRFALAHDPNTRKWGRTKLRGWLKWFRTHGFCCFFTEKGRPVALGCARPVSDPSAGLRHYEYNSSGDTCFIDLAVCRKPEVMEHLLWALQEQVGLREYIAFKRGNKSDRLRVYNLTKFMQKMRRSSHGRRL